MATKAVTKGAAVQGLQIGESEVSRDKARKTLASHMRFASLSETKGQKSGWYWIGTLEMKAFVDPDDLNHRFYRENEDGTYSRISKNDYYDDAKTPLEKRLYITYPAANRILNDNGPVMLGIGVVRKYERLYVLASGKPLHYARVASMPKA